ncbi:LapA family protein [Campylobacter sp. faydin G-105]|uniref:LapA family protein n=1 Tax=Campylobacter anatolicus TaxID=2829105 RepID=UPI001B967049|nr:LapA family protein [Campylobacter anatolicus]MBR8461898.1 LapA family protein [Campylobacter anatolicus]
MKTRKFLIYSIVYICLVGILTYSLNNTEYSSPEILGFSMTMPIAVWVVLPLIVFALLALFHMLFNSFNIYRNKQNIKKDKQLYNDMIKEILLGLESNKEFKTDLFKTASQTLKVLSPWGNYKDLSVENIDIANIIQIIRNIKNGEVADLKKFKLPKDNALSVQNELNKIEKLPNYYMEILKNSNDLNDVLSRTAFNKLLKIAPYTEIKKLNSDMSADERMLVLNRFINDEMDISPDEIYELLDDAKMTKVQYTKAAIMLKNKLKPDAFMSIFEKLKNTHADADEAYIYALYELQMLDQAREALDNSDIDDFKELKTLIFLRDSGKNVSTSIFFK